MSFPPPPKDSKSDDALLQAVLNLPPARRWQLFDRLVGRPELAAVGFRVSERRTTPHPNATRDEQMTRLHDDDKKHLTYPEIARLFHLRPATVARAVQRFRRRRDTESVSPSDSRYDYEWRQP